MIKLSHIIFAALMLVPSATRAQDDAARNLVPENDTLKAETALSQQDNIRLTSVSDSIARKQKRDWTTWKPDPKRALWMALILPGAGQIYNRKYWKLPIIYGGFVGCIYAITWNNQMYNDYSKAYIDISDGNPGTKSYNDFINGTIDETNQSDLTKWQPRFKSRKDTFRRWRDLSVFVTIGVYALSVIDAYVDASLSEFDISDDLSMHVTPAVLNNNSSKNPFKSSALGVNCSLNF